MIIPIISVKQIINDFNENYGQVRKLLDEDCKNDPENEPYLSRYKAKEILIKMRETLTKVLNSETSLDPLKGDAMLGVVLLNIGIIDMDTEELTSSEKVLLEAEELLLPNSSKPEIVTTLINIENNLGVLWSKRNDPEKAKSYLLKSKQLYETFNFSLQMPLPLEYIIQMNSDSITGDIMLLEKAYTLTLFFLAQVYGALKEKLKSALYCHVTLRRQLEFDVYSPVDWVLNAATLSQFFAEHNDFVQSRHHLAAASTMLDQYGDSLLEENSYDETVMAKKEQLNHRSADVARCWVKYCLFLMSASKDRLLDQAGTDEDGTDEADTEDEAEIITDMGSLQLEDNENICGVNISSLVFPDLDVTKYENKIGDKFLLTYSDARAVFLSCQSWLNEAKEYYKLDSLASDYIELVQNSSQSYAYLAFFEEDDERRSKMYKRRVDMVEELLKEINPTYYLDYCRQLWYEISEVYSQMLDLKLEKLKASDNPSPHLLKKINMLCEKSIENSDLYLDSYKDKNGRLPLKLGKDDIRPIISAYVFMGRNSMRRISIDKRTKLTHLKKSLNAYQAVVDICKNDNDAADMMFREFSLCHEMAKMLPIKIRKIESEIV